jgi:hypothetical protein
VSPIAQRFAAAVHTLIGEGPIKARLSEAFEAYLADVAEAELPPTIRDDFGDLKATLSRVAPVGNEGRVRASVQKMSPPEAGGHAATIVKLYVELLGQTERAEPLKVVNTSKSPPPRFLTNHGQ